MNLRRWMVTGLLLAAVLVALAGPAAGSIQAQEAAARVRFLHAVPGGPNVDVYLDGAVIASNLAYGDVTPHISVEGGEHQVALRQSGAGVDAPVLIEVPVPLVPSLAFTVIAQGTPGAVEAALYEDILDEIDMGMARLTAINAIADAPPLDVLTGEGGPLLQGVNYGTQFGTVNIGTGMQNLVVVPAGGAVEGAVASLGDVPLRSGMLYTFVMLGSLEGDVEPSAMVLATPVNGGADSVYVQVAHGSPDAPAVDVYANDTLIMPALAFGTASGHIAVPAGAYALALRPAGAPAADTPVLTADVEFALTIPAVTVAALGELADETLMLQVFPDDVATITSGMARISVINAVPNGEVTAGLSDPSATVLASSLNPGLMSSMMDVAAGDYMLTVSIEGIENPVDLVVPAETYIGGMYYVVLVYGGGAGNVPYDARVFGTELLVTVDSLPSAPVAVAAAPEEVATEEAPAATEEVTILTEEAPPATEEPAAMTEEAPAPEETELVVVPATGSELVAQPTEATEETPPAQPIVPQQAQPVAYVELNPGANLHCRELPGATMRSLGLIPSGATLTVIGRTGEPLVPETGDVTPEPTPVVETLEDLWLSVQWNPESGGYLRCWVAAEFLRVEWKGKLLDDLEELLELPEEPFNRPGEAVDTDVAPPTPLFDAVLATVELEPGVSLQLRRFPQTDAESLDLVPAGAQMEVLGYGESPSEGLVGQPTDPNWLYVRYRKEDGGATIGWVSAEYVSLSKLGREVEMTDLVVVDITEGGFYEAPGQAPVIPIEQQEVVGVVNLNPGANLNLRDRPSADARVVVGIPSGDSMVLNGRNGDGTWVQVTYESDAGKLEGWVATQYLLISRGGQTYDVAELPILTGEEDTTPAEESEPGQ